MGSDSWGLDPSPKPSKSYYTLTCEHCGSTKEYESSSFKGSESMVKCRGWFCGKNIARDVVGLYYACLICRDVFQYEMGRRSYEDKPLSKWNDNFLHCSKCNNYVPREQIKIFVL